MEILRLLGFKDKALVRSAFLANAANNAEKLSPDLKKDYYYFISLVENLNERSSPQKFRKVKSKGSLMIPKIQDKVKTLANNGDYDSATVYARDASSISIISGNRSHKLAIDSLLLEIELEKATCNHMIAIAKDVAELLEQKGNDYDSMISALSISVKSMEKADKTIGKLNILEAKAINNWKKQMLNLKKGVISIIDDKLEKEYKKKFREKHHTAVKPANLKGKGWLMHYKPGYCVSVFDSEYRISLGLTARITKDEMHDALCASGIENREVSDSLWRHLTEPALKDKKLTDMFS